MSSSTGRKNVYISYFECRTGGADGDDDEFVIVEDTEVEIVTFEQIPNGQAGASATEDGIPRTFDGLLEKCCELFGLDYDHILEDDENTPALYQKIPNSPNQYARARSLDNLKDEGSFQFRLVPAVAAKNKKDTTKKTKTKTTTVSTKKAAPNAKTKPKAKTKMTVQKRAKTTAGKPQKSSSSRRTTLNSSGRPERKREAPNFFGVAVDLNDSNDEQLSSPPHTKKKTRQKSTVDDTSHLDEEAVNLYNLCMNEEWNQVFNILRRDKKLALTHLSHYKLTVLHLALGRSSCPDNVPHNEYRFRTIDYILENCPEAASSKTSFNFMPLHTLLSHQQSGMEQSQRIRIVEKLLEINPDAVKVEGGRHKRLPLHFVGLARLSPKITKCIVDLFPGGCLYKDRNGLLPIHTSCRDGGSLKSIKILLREYPSCLWAKLDDGRRLIDFVRDASTAARPLQGIIGLVESEMKRTSEETETEESDVEDDTCTSKEDGRNVTVEKVKKLEKMTPAIYRRLFNYPVGSILAVELFEGFFYEGKITEFHKQGWVRIYIKLIPGGVKSKLYDLRRWRHWVIKSGNDDSDDEDEDSEVGLADSKFTLVSRKDGEETTGGTSLQVVAKRRVEHAGRGDVPDLQDSVRVYWSHRNPLTKEIECPPKRYDGCITDLCWVNINGTWHRFVHVQYVAGKDECWSLPEIFLTNPELQGTIPQDTDVPFNRASANVISPFEGRQLNSDDVDRDNRDGELSDQGRNCQRGLKEGYDNGGGDIENKDCADGEEDDYYDADDGNLQSIVI
mmetsp:Transcript_56329/g.136603  ORF Transcript_56329/g.136603 Transcript_56329/m.136603 type:complete len:787 (+) Transcript_56329:105-2465(+)